MSTSAFQRVSLLSPHLASSISRIQSSHNASLDCFQYRVPLSTIHNHIREDSRRTPFVKHWFRDSSGTLSNSLKLESVFPTKEANKPPGIKQFLNTIPKLQHGLDSVLNAPGAHVFQSFTKDSVPRFPSFPHPIPHPKHISYESMTPFMTPSQDPLLHRLAIENDCNFAASTSSITSALSACYLLISNYKPTYANLLPSFSNLRDSRSIGFTPVVSVKERFLMLRPTKQKNQDGTPLYTVDNEKFPMIPINLILLKLGHSLERALTYSREEFEERFLRSNNTENTSVESPDDQAYHYSKFNQFLVRSQLDCYDAKNGIIFDLKTRATSPIRYNIKEYDLFTREPIVQYMGEEKSFEKEFYDMIRNAFIKYSYQGMLGRMDGMFIAFHNTHDVFGFEYVSLEEINTYVFGSDVEARTCFLYSMSLFEKICQEVTKRFSSTNDNSPSIRLILKPIHNQKDSIVQLLVYAAPVMNDMGWQEIDTVEDSLNVEEFFANENPFGIDQCMGFRVGTRVKRNGRAMNHAITFRPSDDVQVEYFFEELSEPKEEIVNDINKMLKYEVLSQVPGDAAKFLARELLDAKRSSIERQRSPASTQTYGSFSRKSREDLMKDLKDL